jgi:hypothetical protein
LGDFAPRTAKSPNHPIAYYDLLRQQVDYVSAQRLGQPVGKESAMTGGGFPFDTEEGDDLGIIW